MDHDLDTVAAPTLVVAGDRDQLVPQEAVQKLVAAFARSSAERRALREESASPSSSRTVGQTRISTGTARSRTICLTTAACCASFWPK